MEIIFSKIAVMLVPGLLAITLHEVAHGYVAERFGDPTARLLGRLTLNPLKHLDPIGTIAIFLVKFGWARPVPVNAGNFRHPRRDMIWVALAGPLVNLLLAIVSVLILKLFGVIEHTALGDSEYYLHIASPIRMMASFSLFLNLVLMVFNLLPIPPLDGGRILSGVIPEKQAAFINRFESLGYVLILCVVFFTNIWTHVFAPLIIGIVEIMAGSDSTYIFQTMQFLSER